MADIRKCSLYPLLRSVISCQYNIKRGSARSTAAPAYICAPTSPTHFTPHPASARSNVVRGSWSFVIINYAETRRLNVIFTSAMVLNDPQPQGCTNEPSRHLRLQAQMLKMTRFTVFCRHILINDMIYGVFQAHFSKMVWFMLFFRHILANYAIFASTKQIKLQAQIK